MNIQKKLAVTISILSLVSITLLATISISNSIDTLRSEVENSLNALVDEKVHAIDNYISNKKNQTSIFSILPIVSSAMRDYKRSFKSGVLGAEYQQADKSYRTTLSQLREAANNYDLLLISPQGDIVFSVLKEKDFSTNLITGSYQHTNLANTFNKVSKNSRVEISKFEPYIPSQFKRDELATNKKQLEGVGWQSHSAFVASPIFNDGNLIGIIAMQLNSNDYFHLAADYAGLKTTGEIVISEKIDNYAVVVAPLRHRDNAAFKLKFLIGSKNALQIQQSVLGNQGSGLSIGYDATEILAAWRYIPEFSWGVVVKMDTSEAFKATEKLRYHFILVGGIIVIISLIVGLFLSLHISRPLLALVDFTNNVAKGDFSKKLIIDSKDEIGLLAESFNHMLMAKLADDLVIKNSEKNLQQYLVEVERYKFAMDEHAIVSSSDVKGHITYVNQKFVDVSGYSSSEVIGNNHRIINSKYHESSFFKKMYQSISSGKVWKGDIRNQKKDSSYYWVRTTIIPFLNEKNKPILYMAIRTEITENIVNINRLALIKDQLTEQVSKLSEANQELDQFAYVASHDLKSPLNGINQLVSWIEEDCRELLPDDSKEHLTLLKNRSKRMMVLLSDLLDYSRIGRQQHNVECFSLSDMVKDVFELQGNREGFKCDSVELSVILQKTPFEMVLRNLVSNAIKHHDKQKGTIFVGATVEGDFYKFSIEDDGPGIPLELHEKALEMFQTLQSRDKTEGSGMGLALVKKMVEHHGGEFTISPRTGRGSHFIVKWPIGSINTIRS